MQRLPLRKSLLMLGRAASLLASLLVVAACAQPAGMPPQSMQERPPTPVSTLTVQRTNTEVYQEYPGRVRGAREVAVLARVQGILEQRLYQEGALVQSGDPLFRIEREPFEIAIKAAQAGQATAEATLRQTEREWRRVASLFEQNAISERERDNALSAYELAKAQVLAAKARLEQAELDLRYTEVTAPLSGATSLEAQPEGSLVGPGTLLTTIVELDPVHVAFSVPEQDALLQRAARQALQEGDASAYLHEARLLLTDGTEYPDVGEVDFTASIVDSHTGTVSARVIFPNPGGALVPGQFVRIRMLQQQLTEVVLAPEEVISQSATGAQAFVVDATGQAAEVRPLTLGPVIDGQQAVLSGLETGDQLIVSGQAGLWHGAPIVITEPEAATTRSNMAGAEGDA